MKKKVLTLLLGLLTFISLTISVEAEEVYTIISSVNPMSTGATNDKAYVGVSSEDGTQRELICISPGLWGAVYGEEYTEQNLDSDGQEAANKLGCYIMENERNYTGFCASADCTRTNMSNTIHDYLKDLLVGRGWGESANNNTIPFHRIVTVLNEDSILNSACYRYCKNLSNITITPGTQTIDGQYYKIPVTITSSNPYNIELKLPGNGKTTFDKNNKITETITATSSGATSTVNIYIKRSDVTGNTQIVFRAETSCEYPHVKVFERSKTVSGTGAYIEPVFPNCDQTASSCGWKDSDGNYRQAQSFITYEKIPAEKKANKTIIFKVMAGKLEITKTDKESGSKIDGAKFKIYKDEKCTTEATDINGNQIGEVTTTNGVITIENLLPGTYYVKETTSPNKNYLITKEVTSVQIEAGATKKITITNDPLGEIVIQKKDKDTTKVLPGAEFELYKCDANGTNCTKITDATKDAEGKAIVKKKEINGKTYYALCTTNGCETTGTNSSGQIVINKIKYGYYKIKEIQSPTIGNQGYVLIDNMNESSVELSPTSTCSTYRPNAIANEEAISCQEVVIINNPITIKLVKLGLDKNGKIPEEPKKLKDVTFKITSNVTTDIWDDITIIKDEGIIVGIKPGTYTIKEVISPKGYASTFATVSIRVNQDGTIIVLDNNDMVKTYKKGETTGLGIKAEIPELDFYNRPSNLIISKQDLSTGAELPGATLEITCEDGFKESWVSEIEQKELYITPNTTCKLKETASPEGYEVEQNELEFKIDDQGNVVSIKDLKEESNYKLEANRIILYNGLKVPNTGKTLSIVVILLGIGLISGGMYIVIKKIKEEQ